MSPTRTDRSRPRSVVGEQTRTLAPPADSRAATGWVAPARIEMRAVAGARSVALVLALALAAALAAAAALASWAFFAAAAACSSAIRRSAAAMPSIRLCMHAWMDAKGGPVRLLALDRRGAVELQRASAGRTRALSSPAFFGSGEAAAASLAACAASRSLIRLSARAMASSMSCVRGATHAHAE